MKGSATPLFWIFFCVATLVGGTASADSAVDRLFVLVSPPDIAGPSAIVAFDVGSDGIPTQAESYSTRGTGRGQNSPQGIVTDAGGRFLFAANNESHDIAVFTIRPDGTLATVEGSPFAVGEAPITYSPVYLAATPDASFLYVAAQGALVAFEIDDDGALDPIQSLPGTMAEIVTSPDGEYLYAAGLHSGAVHAFRIDSNGLLEELDQSPFAYDADRPYQVVVSADGLRVWVLDLDTGIAAFDVAGGGALQLSGQTATGTFAIALETAAEDAFLYAAPPFEPAVLGFAATLTAPVALPSSPFPAGYTGIELLASPDGMRLYQVTADLATILAMAVETNGVLSPIGLPVAVETGNDSIPNGASYFGRAAVRIAIDVRPGSDRNSIQLRSRGVLPVAILGSADFDVADVDQASVRFGPDGATPAHRLPHRLLDIDGDGDLDVVLHFRTEATGIACGDVTAELAGLAFDGREFGGGDAVGVLGCGGRGPRGDGPQPTRPQR